MLRLIEDSSTLPYVQKSLGMRRFIWPNATRHLQNPNIHLMPAKSPEDIALVESMKENGKYLTRSFAVGNWSILADKHVSMFTEKEYFEAVLRDLVAHQNVSFIGPIARSDHGSTNAWKNPSPPYQLYIQIGDYPDVFELDVKQYNFSIKAPLCRNPSIEGALQPCDNTTPLLRSQQPALYKITYYTRDVNDSIAGVLGNILMMEEDNSVPSSLRSWGIRWFKWPGLDHLSSRKPEIHLVPAQSDEAKALVDRCAVNSKHLADKFNAGQWSILADKHASVWVESAYFEAVLRRLQEPGAKFGRIPYIRPIARADNGTAIWNVALPPYALYVLIDNNVLELTAISYNFTIAPPLCRNPENGLLEECAPGLP